VNPARKQRFTVAKRFEFVFGGATEQALRIGRAFAAS